MELKAVIAATERLDSSDGALSIRLARAVSDSETEAWGLIGQAEERAQALAATDGFQHAVLRVAGALLKQRELNGAEVRALINEGDTADRRVSRG